MSVEATQERRAHARPVEHRIGTPLRAPDVALRRVLAVGDAVAVFAALLGAFLLTGSRHPGNRIFWGLIALPLMVLLFKIYGLYDRDVKRISHSTADDVPWLFHAIVVGALLLWLYSKVTPLHRMNFEQIVAFGCLTLVGVMAIRSAVRHSSTAFVPAESALLLGGGTMARVLVSKLAAHPEYRLKVVGILSTRPGASSLLPELPALGTVDDLERLADEHGVSRVIVSAADLDDDQLERVLRRCREVSLKLSLVPDLSEVLGPTLEVDDVEGVTVLGVNPPWLPRSSRILKRALDVLVAASMLLLLSPVLALIAIAVRIDSGGPILFAQERVGYRGRHFRLLKFRTMVSDAEQRRDELLGLSKDPHWLFLEHDPRITRVGRRLRRLSLDELPQLWNVLRGQMSMVGPRPLIVSEDDRVQGWVRGRLDLMPGLTGYWQVLGRTRIPFEEMVKLDYLYVMTWSLWGDVRLILHTLPALLSGRGAN